MTTPTIEASEHIPLIRGLVDVVVRSSKISLSTPEVPAFVDITDQVVELVEETGVALSVVINEQESMLMKDIWAFLDRLAPKDGKYFHNDFDVRQPD